MGKNYSGQIIGLEGKIIVVPPPPANMISMTLVGDDDLFIYIDYLQQDDLRQLAEMLQSGGTKLFLLKGVEIYKTTKDAWTMINAIRKTNIHERAVIKLDPGQLEQLISLLAQYI